MARVILERRAMLFPLWHLTRKPVTAAGRSRTEVLFYCGYRGDRGAIGRIALDEIKFRNSMSHAPYGRWRISVATSNDRDFAKKTRDGAYAAWRRCQSENLHARRFEGCLGSICRASLRTRHTGQSCQSGCPLAANRSSALNRAQSPAHAHQAPPWRRRRRGRSSDARRTDGREPRGAQTASRPARTMPIAAA